MPTQTSPLRRLKRFPNTRALFFLLATALTTSCTQAQPPLAPSLPATAYELEDALGGMKFTQPLAIVSAPAETDRLFIVEKTGKIQSVRNLSSDKPQSHVFLDLSRPRDGALESSSECGVLGLAFHPDYPKNGRFFVYYSLKISGQLHQRVSQFLVSKADGNQADPASEQPLFSQQDAANNHNGGDLALGPDGYLYISVGDGGAGNDTLNQARFINKGFHAAILRIDVDRKPGSLPPNQHPGIALDPASNAAHYAIPPDNPFIGATSHHGETIDPATVRTEIWATGLRNPWRISFDPDTQRMFTGDVGQNLHEEIDIIVKGGDYGWSHREGNHPFLLGPGGAKEPPAFKPINPIYDYPRTTGLSVTGGIVYHGKKFPQLQKAYIFADFAFGRIIALRENSSQWQAETLVPAEPGIAGIGRHPADGEVLFANMASGKIRRLAPKQK